MFNNLTERLTISINKLRGLGRLTEENIKSALRETQTALLQADVALSVVKDFISRIQEKAIGQEIIGNIRPGDALVKIIQDELSYILGDSTTEINLNAKPPIVMVVAGLQGSGKTTTTAKLAKWLKETHGKSVMLASADVYRPAAIQQLETLAKQIDVHFFPTESHQKPTTIAATALKQAEKQFIDVLILDTAGRLHIDEALMEEIKAIHETVNSTEILLVVDSMMGQDAANVAKSFNDQLPLTGIILTKVDGDARGGAALSMRMITQKPIKFVGVGEKIDALEPFHPTRVASRILGMGDIVSLVEEAQRKINQTQAKKIAKKLRKGHQFDFNDLFTQLEQMKKMGGVQSLLGKLPQQATLQFSKKMGAAFPDDKLIVKFLAIIQSMTPQERSFPALMNGSRKRRIANGSGTTVQEVNKLTKQYTQTQKLMKRTMKGGKMARMLRQAQGQLPPNSLLNQLPPSWRDK